MKENIEWVFKTFHELKPTELYEILKVRQEVFVLEQNIRYLDPDDKDKKAWHLFAWHPSSEKVYAYLRVLPPGKMKYHSIGRVLTPSYSRGQGYGREMMRQVLTRVEHCLGPVPLSMSAQSYLEGFYQECGFETCSDTYIEEGIAHVEMSYSPNKSTL